MLPEMSRTCSMFWGRSTVMMEVLLKHIETEDTRLAKWVRDQERRQTVGKTQEHTCFQEILDFHEPFSLYPEKKKWNYGR